MIQRFLTPDKLVAQKLQDALDAKARAEASAAAELLLMRRADEHRKYQAEQQALHKAVADAAANARRQYFGRAAGSASWSYY